MNVEQVTEELRLLLQVNKFNLTKHSYEKMDHYSYLEYKLEAENGLCLTVQVRTLNKKEGV